MRQITGIQILAWLQDQQPANRPWPLLAVTGENRKSDWVGPTSMDEKDFAEVQHSQGEILVLPLCANVCGAKSLLLCLTVCHPTDCNPPGSSVLGILQARVLEWVAMSFSRESSQPRDRIWVSWSFCIKGRFFTTEPLGNPDSTGARKKKKKQTLYPLEEAGPCHPSNKARHHRAELAGNSVSQEAKGRGDCMPGYPRV